jgi:segregation and condensation protein A
MTHAPDATAPAALPDGVAPQAVADAVAANDAPAGGDAATRPQQQEMRLATVHGQPVLQIPQDLYIPPDALEVILEAFEGPLDLLLYLIRRQNLDIIDIPVAEITRQYVDYITVMHELRFELAAEYLVMAAILAEIKSRMLLPRPPQAEGEEEDPRAELVRRLQEYERFKKAAQDIDTLPRMERDTHEAHAFVPEHRAVREPPKVELKEMLLALSDVLKRAELFGQHSIKREALSVRARMGELLARLGDGQFQPFVALFKPDEGRLGVVVNFLAILELAKERLLEIVQEAAERDNPFPVIYVRSLAASDDGPRPAFDAREDDEGADEGDGAFEDAGA